MAQTDVQALLLDLSGVLYEGRQAIDGACDAVTWARQQGLTLRFVTNTATESSADLVRRLTGMGLSIEPSELFTAPRAAKTYVASHQWRPFCLLHPALRDEWADLDASDPNCVVLGDARDALNYEHLNAAFRLCMTGAPLIGIGLNKYFKDEDGLKLDAGPFITALEWATDTPAVIMGKPSPDFFEQVVDSTGVPAEHCLMIGDDWQADVEGAIKAGLQGCLVRTGKYQPGDESKQPQEAGVIDSISALPTWLIG